LKESPSETEAILAEQIRYYRARALEYDEWWERLGRYDRGSEESARWFSEQATAGHRERKTLSNRESFGCPALRESTLPAENEDLDLARLRLPRRDRLRPAGLSHFPNVVEIHE
jgi:hypothetical protein